MSVSKMVTFKTVVFLMLLLALPLFSKSDGGSNEPVCTVKGILGDVKIHRTKVRREEAVSKGDAAGWAAVQLNMVLREKDIVQTLAQSEVRLETPNGSVIKLGENTTLEISELKQSSSVSKTKIKLIGGSMVTNVKKLVNNKSAFEIQTPTATAAVRGTIVELDVGSGGLTEVKVFNGKVLVAPAGSKSFVEVGDRQAVDIAPKQKKLVVKEVPKDYKPRTTKLTVKASPDEAAKTHSAPKTAASGGKAKESALVKLSLKLDDPADTINSYLKESITIKGVVAPPDAKVSVNGKAAKPDTAGVFELVMKAPSDTGVFTLKVVADNKESSETVLRTVKVAHAFTEVKLISPAEGLVVTAPSVLVSGTAASGSKVNIGEKSINVERDGTFSAEIALPDKEGGVKLDIEIVDNEDNAVWFTRHVRYKKAAE
ncbi:MAG: FecR family protein [Chitinispirillales bacterium]|jgi:hypothetical protein|nr:FecR family protein [Chitinispirillales bacterium]